MSTDTHAGDDSDDDGLSPDLWERLADEFEGELVGDICEIISHSASDNREANR